MKKISIAETKLKYSVKVVVSHVQLADGTSEMILGLDEFDKVNRCSKEGDPMNVFLRLFQGLHYDKYLQCHISTENTIFIATANSIEDIPETILNRFNAIIYFDEYKD